MFDVSDSSLLLDARAFLFLGSISCFCNKEFQQAKKLVTNIFTVVIGIFVSVYKHLLYREKIFITNNNLCNVS